MGFEDLAYNYIVFITLICHMEDNVGRKMYWQVRLFDHEIILRKKFVEWLTNKT